MQFNPVSNTRATLSKYRALSVSDWNAVLAQLESGRGLVKLEASTGRTVTFTRAEIEFLKGRAA